MRRQKVLVLGAMMAMTATCMPWEATSGTDGSKSENPLPRTRDFCLGWRFFEGDVEHAEKVDFRDSGWRAVDLPHDWSIEGPKSQDHPGGERIGYLPTGIGWYRKEFSLLPKEEGRKVFVQFDGVYCNSKVWINGHFLGGRPNGYASFEFDLTPHVEFGASNLLAVRVDNSAQPNSRWYTGSGIYRRVHLTVVDRLHITQWGTSVTTPEVSGELAVVRVATRLANEHKASLAVRLRTRIMGPDGNVVGTDHTEQRLDSGTDGVFVQDFKVRHPALWDVTSPTLYRVESAVLDGDATVDRCVTPFGIRTIACDKNRGLLLNGKPLKMKGVNIHHDGGCLGSAVPIPALERRLKALKSIGCNAIRTSHNPPAPDLLDLCDQMGFVVIDEAFDKWGPPYNPSFAEWGRRDLESMILRDRNHPSVVMWSVGNEVPGQGSAEFHRVLGELVSWARAADPTRPVTVALCPKKKKADEMTREVVEIASKVDVISCNYQEQWFESYRQANPEMLIIGSEIYPFFRGNGDQYKAFHPVNPWLDAEKHDYVLGSFYWTGIDYLGEAVAKWPYHGWNCSLIDSCGWVRPVGQLARSFWSEEPMVHLAVMDESLDVQAPVKDHWGWPKMASHWDLASMDGKKVKVATFTNCKEVELLLNGKSLGTKKLADFKDRIISWEVPWKAGCIEAVGKMDGVDRARHQLRTSGKAGKISLSADRDRFENDGHDLCHVEVQITDNDGIPVYRADPEIRFRLEGPGKIIGVDNGDLTSMEPYQCDRRKAFYGRALVVIRAGRGAGRTVKLHAEADGLQGADVEIQVNGKERFSGEELRGNHSTP